MESIDGELLIEYPCEWVFKIIGWCPDAIQDAITSVLGPTPYTLTPSRRSRMGTYVSMSLCVMLTDDAMRLRIYRDLAAQEAIKTVL